MLHLPSLGIARRSSCPCRNLDDGGFASVDLGFELPHVSRHKGTKSMDGMAVSVMTAIATILFWKKQQQ